MNKAKTNNSFLHDKVALRVACLPDGDSLRVLDCYHGAGTIWRNVQRNTSKRLTVHGIDISDDDENMAVLLGDNIKVLSSLKIENYDIIDLDAWGVPSRQFAEVWERARPGAIVFYTFIQSVTGALSLSLFLLLRLGFSQSMLAKAPSLFNRHGHAKWLAFLSTFGVKQVRYCKHGRKFYGAVVKS